MFRTLDCIANQHNPWLLALAVCICATASITTFRLFTRARTAEDGRRLGWLCGAGLAGGSGIWATHFISMLAYNPGLPTGYEPFGTLASLVVAVVGVTLALTAATSLKRRAGVIIGGILLGLAVTAMHDTGMAAFRTRGVLNWDQAYAAVAVTGSVVFSILALAIVMPRRSWAADIAGTLTLAVAIVILHFVSMAAITVVPDGSRAVPSSLLPNGVMAVGVGVLAGLILLGAVCIIALEARGHRRTLRELTGVIEAMPDGLAYFDAQDRFLLWNAKYAAMLAPFGLTPRRGETYADCILRPAAATGVFHRSREPGWVEEQIARRQEPVSSRDEQTPDGRWTRVAENRAEGGGRVSVVFDITALKQNAQALAEARDLAEAANRAKSEFLANMSHEIRTPLNGVMGVADALALTELSPQQGELVTIIRESGDTLNRLLCDILDLARVESGKLELSPEPFKLGDLMRAHAQTCLTPAREKGIGFRLEMDQGAERWVMADAVRLNQILANLTSNAIKFTEAGEVCLAVACLDSYAGRYEIKVSDTGPGFDEAAKARLFGRFQQGDGSMTRRFGGSGLGLAIVRQLADLMGARLDVSGREGEGAVFALTLDLPATEAPSAGPLATAPQDHAEREAALRVLVVDDNAHNRRLLEVLLSHVGADCASVEDGQQAVDAWQDGGFDLVLMDMQMPVMDGLTAVRRIREAEGRDGRARTPVIMVSANAMPEHIAAGREAGADGHIAKPITADQLFSAVASLGVEAEASAAA